MRALCCAAALLLGGCTTLAPEEFRTFAKDGAVSRTTIDFHGLHLASGQVIASDAGAPDSILLSLIAERYTPFVHAGIVSIESGKPFVYESVATVRPHLSGPPTAAMGGGVRRVTLQSYLARQHVTAIFEPHDGIDRDAIARYARVQHAEETHFDPYFDWSDHSRFYCTEFFALALAAGGARLPQPVRIRDNRSLRTALRWLRVAAPEIVTVATLTEQTRRIALISRDLDRGGIDAYFAAKEQLHLRFTDDQRLGFVWSKAPFGLRLRPHVAAFLERHRTHPGESPAEAALAAFGPVMSANPARVSDATR